MVSSWVFGALGGEAEQLQLRLLRGHLQGEQSPTPPGHISLGVRVLPSCPGSFCWLQAVTFG